MNYLKAALLALSILSISGCSTTAGIATSAVASAIGGGSGPSLEVSPEIVAGDKTQELQVGDTQMAKVINNINEIPTLYLLIMILGWMAPSPGNIYKEFKNLISRTCGGFINLIKLILGR